MPNQLIAMGYCTKNAIEVPGRHASEVEQDFSLPSIGHNLALKRA